MLMNKETKNLLIKNLVELVDSIDLNVALWNELISRHVFTKTQQEDIICNERHTSSVQKEKLLYLLPRRGQEKFEQFCLALVATEQESVVTDILGFNIKQSDNGFVMERCQRSDSQQVHHANIATAPVNIRMPPHSTSLPMHTAAPSGCSDAPSLPCLPDLSSSQSSIAHKRPSEDTEMPWKKVCPAAPHESEDNDGIELTDAWGVQPEPIVTSTEQFYITHNNYREVYPMHQYERGYCFIINVTNVRGEPRRGTEVDNSQLIHLFRGLHFNVQSYSDQDGLIAEEIYKKVKSFFMMPQHDVSDCAVLCILSHGEANCIYGTDGNMVRLTDLYKLMNDCPGLDNKPKLVFLEACSGLSYDNGKNSNSTLYGEDQSDAPSKLPFMADFFIGCPSQPGMRAHRNTKHGSWYIQAIVKVFSKFAASRNLLELMTKVNAAVARKESKCSDPSKTGKKQIPDQRSTLRRNLYFFPGIQRTHPN